MHEQGRRNERETRLSTAFVEFQGPSRCRTAVAPMWPEAVAIGISIPYVMHATAAHLISYHLTFRSSQMENIYLVLKLCQERPAFRFQALDDIATS